MYKLLLHNYKSDDLFIYNKFDYNDKIIYDIYTLDVKSYEILYNIFNLFTHNNNTYIIHYKSIITKEKYFTYHFTFTNSNDITHKFNIVIYNKYFIKVSVPIKKSNYYYTTFLYTIFDLYNYLYLHLHL
jgi:hypothetical protein